MINATNPNLDDLSFPASDIDSRLAWAGERMWDLAEGVMSAAQGHLIVAVILGWADLGIDAERDACRQMAGRISELLAA